MCYSSKSVTCIKFKGSSYDQSLTCERKSAVGINTISPISINTISPISIDKSTVGYFICETMGKEMAVIGLTLVTLGITQHIIA